MLGLYRSCVVQGNMEGGADALYQGAGGGSWGLEAPPGHPH